MNKLIITPLALAGLALSGCLSSVLPDPAPAAVIYRLSSAGEAAAPSQDAVVMRIDRPLAPSALSGVGVVVSPDGRRLATAQQARWSEGIPAMVQGSFFNVLSARSDIVGILPASGARSLYRAHLTITDFQAEFDQGETNAPLAVVQYTASVADSKSRDLVGTLTVKKTVRADSPRVSAIVNAQDQANAQALAEIADWIEGLNLKS